MTTFQDPPPQSRRAVRQSERAEHPDAEQPYSFDPASPEGIAEAAAEAARAHASHAGGHRADSAAHVAPAGTSAVDGTSAVIGAESMNSEPLHYMTQARVHQEPVASAQTEPPLPSEHGTFRVRDYSPEGRRAAISREAFAGVTSTPAAPSAPRPFDRPQPVPPSQVDLDYFTQGAPVAVTPPSVAPVVPAVPLVPTPAPAVATQVGSAVGTAHGAGRGTGESTDKAPDTDQFDHTMTRRELRELRAAQERQAQPRNPEPIDNILNSGPIPIPVLSVLPGQSQALADAMAEFDQLAHNRRDLEHPVAEAAAPPAPAQQVSPVDEEPPVVQAPPAAPASAAQAFPFRLTAPSATEPPAPAAFVPPPLVEPQRLPTGALEQALKEPEFASLADIAPTLAAPASTFAEDSGSPVDALPGDAAPIAALPVDVAPIAALPVDVAPIAATSVESSPADSAPFVAAPATASPAALPVALASAAPMNTPVQAPVHHDTPVGSADAVFLEPDRTSSKPVGHWSVQAEMDDDDLGFENTVSRTVGAGTAAITTSALVLPSVPEMGDLLHPFTSTGEILVTGSIDLPRSLGSTGAHPHRVDNSDFEDDPLDSEVVSTDSAPVRAIRAISTHTSTRGVIEQKRRQTSRMPAIMIVVASVLALGVVALLAVAFATHLL